MSQKWDMGGSDLAVNSLYVGATAPGVAGTLLSGSEITVLDGVTPGTATASKAVVLGASKEIATITTATITNIGTTTLTPTTIAGAANFTGTPTFAAGATVTGTVAATAFTGTTTATMTSANASALAVGLAGATNPSFVVDSSTASQAAGLKITGAVAAGTVAAAVISSGADASLTVNAKGAGTIGIGNVSTGDVTITPATTITGALTLNGVATFNSNPVIGAGKTINLDSETATLSSNAATLTKYASVITTESLTTAHTATETFVLTLTGVAAGDLAFVTLCGGTNTTGDVGNPNAVTSTNTITVTIKNEALVTNAFNGTLKFNLLVLKA